MIFKRVSPSTTINFYLTAQHRVKHFSLNSTGRGHCNPTERHQNRAENVFRALWLQNVWFCAFSRFSIKFWQDEVFCTLTLWFPRFIASSQSGGSEFGKPQHLGTFRQPCAKSAPRRRLQLSALWALMLQERRIIMIFLIVHFNTRGDWLSCL